MNTFSQIISKVGVRVGDTSSGFSTTIGMYVNDRYLRVFKKFNWPTIVPSYSITTTADTTDYVLPSDFKHELYVFDTTNNKDIVKMSLQDLEITYPDGLLDQGNVFRYAIFESLDDGIDSFTELLLSLNNNVTDISSNGFTVTNNGVTFDNTLPAFAGTYYGVFNGTSAYLSIPNSADFNFTSDFTVDGWFNFASNSETYDLFGNGYEVGIFLTYTGNKLYLTLGTTPFLLEPAFTPTINTWYHLAVVRASGTVTIYVNGNSIGSGSYATALSSTYAMYIGYDPIGGIYFAGKISEFRMSNVARWTSNFTPPTQPYSAGHSTSPSPLIQKTLRFFENPTQICVYNVPYIKQGVPLVATTDFPIIDMADLASELGATADAWRTKRQFQKASDFEVQYEKVIQEMVWSIANDPNMVVQFRPNVYPIHQLY